MSTHVRRWKVVQWDDPPVLRRTIVATCPKCEWDGELEIGETLGALIIATIGLGIVFEPSDYRPPTNFMPAAIQCRGCRRVWSEEVAEVA